MAKKKAEPAAGTGDRIKPNALAIRGSVEWRAWLGEAADFMRCQSVADLIDRAVADYARRNGFTKGAPKR